ncbi:hypothetical protein ACIBLA_31965 [Streptomyces sp. NPDC050433]|uniref:hypothetical protein n=1 Tax=Streptomyces sp. NPDC050433 TaxID=3365615 RepID=UPI0037A5EDD0
MVEVQIEKAAAGGCFEGGAESAHDLPRLGPLLKVPLDRLRRCAQEAGEPVGGGDGDVPEANLVLLHAEAGDVETVCTQRGA